MLNFKYVVYDYRPNKNGLCQYYNLKSLNKIVEPISQIVANADFHFSKPQIYHLYQNLYTRSVNTSHIVVTPLYQFKVEVKKLQKTQ